MPRSILGCLRIPQVRPRHTSHPHRLTRATLLLALSGVSVALVGTHPSGRIARASVSTYYVSPTGDDANPGTLAQPFATIAHAAVVVAAGDTVLVRGGVYSLATSPWIVATGTAAARISFASYPGETAVLDGASLPAGAGCLTVGGSYIDIVGFECRNAPGTGISVWGGSHIMISGNTIHDTRGGGIGIGYSTMGVVSDVRVAGNTVYHTVLANSARTASGGWASAVGTYRASGVTITGNTVFANDGEGIDLNLTDNSTATGNTVHDNFSVELYLDNATNSTVERNLVYTTHDPAYERFGAPAVGIAMANEYYSAPNPLDHDTVCNNVVIGGRYGFYYGNYGLGGGLKDSLVANNTFYGDQATTTLLSIDADPGHNNTVFANNLFDMPTSAPLSGLASGMNLTFTHNAWWGGSGGAGTTAGSGDLAVDPALSNPGTSSAEGYRPRPGSPLIGAGVQISAVADDYDGALRPQGQALSIGAFQAVTAATPVATATLAPLATATFVPTAVATATPLPTAVPTDTSIPTSPATTTPRPTMPRPTDPDPVHATQTARALASRAAMVMVMATPTRTP